MYFNCHTDVSQVNCFNVCMACLSALFVAALTSAQMPSTIVITIIVITIVIVIAFVMVVLITVIPRWQCKQIYVMHI